jgi:hypothetical protein
MLLSRSKDGQGNNAEMAKAEGDLAPPPWRFGKRMK